MPRSLAAMFLTNDDGILVEDRQGNNFAKLYRGRFSVF